MIIFLALVLIIFNDSDCGERGAVSLMTLAGNICNSVYFDSSDVHWFPGSASDIWLQGQESAIIPCSTRMETIQRHGRLFWLPCL